MLAPLALRVISRIRCLNRSRDLSVASVEGATQSRSPGVISAAFRAQSPNLRFAPLMDMDFAVRCPLVRCSRLLFDFCPSTRTFAWCFLQTPPRGDGPCTITKRRGLGAAARQQAVVADAVKAVRQNMQDEAPDE